ncbi:MAG: hypothetical protein IJ151_08280 [Bacteroidales bacterium]|nr:hypothetical protein [Bacteroidales bacterium]
MLEKIDNFKQIFPNIHHRDHGTLFYILRTHELHPDGKVRVVVVDYLDHDKRKLTRKVYFSTDLPISAR